MKGTSRAFAALALTAASGCFHPDHEACRVACIDDGDCAPGHACGAAGLCGPREDSMACGPPISPAGMYDLLLTVEDNQCGFPNWQTGSTANVRVEIRENGTLIVA